MRFDCRSTDSTRARPRFALSTIAAASYDGDPSKSRFASRIRAAGADVRPDVGVALSVPLGGRLRPEGRHHLEVLLRHEVANLELARHQHRERRRLHATDRQVVVVEQAVHPRQVHADEPVGAAPRARRIGRGDRTRWRPLERAEPLRDGLGRERRDPQAADGLSCPRRLVDVAEDELSLAPRVGRAHDAGGVLREEQAPHDVELRARRLGDDEWPRGRQERQVREAPLLPRGVHLVRLGESDQVPDGPRHDVVAPREVSVVARVCAEHRPAAMSRATLGFSATTRVVMGEPSGWRGARESGTSYPIGGSLRRLRRFARAPATPLPQHRTVPDDLRLPSRPCAAARPAPPTAARPPGRRRPRGPRCAPWLSSRRFEVELPA